LESFVISRVALFGTIIKLVSPFQNACQEALRGHIISFPMENDAMQKVTALPRTSFNDLAVVFIGKESHWTHQKNRILKGQAYRQDIFQVRPHVVFLWLTFLQRHNRYYHDIEIIPQADHLNFEKQIRELLDGARVVEDNRAIHIENVTTSDVAQVRPQMSEDIANNNGNPTINEQQETDTPLARVMLSRNVTLHNSDDLTRTALDVVMDLTIARPERPDFSDIPTQEDEDVGREEQQPASSDAARTEAANNIGVNIQAEQPVNEFTNNDGLYAQGFPHLFPFGRGIQCKGSIPTHVRRHLLRYYDNRFERSAFKFLVFNQIQRHATCRSSRRLLVKNKDFEKFSKMLKDPEFVTALESAVREPDKPESRLLALKLLKYVRIAGANVPYGQVERASVISRLMSMLHFHGLPSMFVTISPSDIDNRLTLRLSAPWNMEKNEGIQVNVEVSKSEIERCKAVVANGARAADEFHSLISAVCAALLQSPISNEVRKTVPLETSDVRPSCKRDNGIFGLTVGHYSVVEQQGRGSLHIHMLYWGGVSPTYLSRVCRDEALLRTACRHIDEAVRAHLTPEEITQAKERQEQRRPAFRGSLSDPQEDPTSEEYRNRVSEQAKCVQIHSHTFTCQKGRNGKYQCRLAYQQPPSVDPMESKLVELKIDPDTGFFQAQKVAPSELTSPTERCTAIHDEDPFLASCEDHPILFFDQKRPEHSKYVVPMSDPLLNCISCNHSINLLGSSEQAIALVFYMVQYMCKDGETLNNSLSCLFEAIKVSNEHKSSVAEGDAKTTPEQRETLFVLQKMGNNLVGMMEVSDQMASACLLNHPASFGSEEFSYVFAQSFISEALKNLEGAPPLDTSSSSSDDDAEESDETSIASTLNSIKEDDIECDDEDTEVAREASSRRPQQPA
jgi:hypothetical protein